MLFLTFFPPYQSQLCHATFWLVLLAWALLSVGVIFWLRKGLKRLEASRLLPIEYGTVTATSVLGGLMLYQEAAAVPRFNLAMMGGGIVLICGGCALVGQRKTIKRRYMPAHVVAHRCIPLLRSQVARLPKPGRHRQLVADLTPPEVFPDRLSEVMTPQDGVALSPKPQARQAEGGGDPLANGHDPHAAASSGALARAHTYQTDAVQYA